MKKLQALIACAAALLTAVSGVSAETSAENSGNAGTLSLHNQNTDITANVIKNTNNRQELIYSGPLSGYADGEFSGFDFGQSSFLLLFDWDDPDSIVIFPASQPATLTPQTDAAPVVTQDASGPFKLRDALDHIDSSGAAEKTIYNVDLLPEEYLESMSALDIPQESTGGGSASPAPAISYDYQISAVNLRDSEDRAADRLINGGALQSVTVTSNGANDDIILAVAEYNGYTLKKLTSYEISLDENQDVVMTNYSLADITADTSVKLFVWDAYWGTNPQAYPVTLFTENSIDAGIQFLYNQAYSEKQLQKGQTLTAQAGMKSTAWWPQSASLYLALYDETGALSAVSTANGTISSNGTYQFLHASLPLDQNLPDGYQVRAYLWDSRTLRPYTNCETIISAADSYSDTLADAAFFDLEKPINGMLQTPDDVDYIKVIPSKTGDYCLQLAGNSSLQLRLYQEDGTLIPETGFYADGMGTVLKHVLTKGSIYYIEISGQATDTYTLTVTPNTAAEDCLEVSGNQFTISGTAAGQGTYKVSLLTAAGNLITAQDVTSGENREYQAVLSASCSDGDYYVTVSKGNAVKKLWKLRAIWNQSTFHVSEGDYISIPVVSSGAENLDGIYFSAAYDSEYFALYDACELTESTETSPAVLSEESLRITSIQPTGVIFASSASEQENHLVNIIKLKAKQNGSSAVTVCAYVVE